MLLLLLNKKSARSLAESSICSETWSSFSDLEVMCLPVCFACAWCAHSALISTTMDLTLSVFRCYFALIIQCSTIQISKVFDVDTMYFLT